VCGTCTESDNKVLKIKIYLIALVQKYKMADPPSNKDMEETYLPFGSNDKNGFFNEEEGGGNDKKEEDEDNEEIDLYGEHSAVGELRDDFDSSSLVTSRKGGLSMNPDDEVWKSFNNSMQMMRSLRSSQLEVKSDDEEFKHSNGCSKKENSRSSIIDNANIRDIRRWEKRMSHKLFDEDFVTKNLQIKAEIVDMCTSLGLFEVLNSCTKVEILREKSEHSSRIGSKGSKASFVGPLVGKELERAFREKITEKSVVLKQGPIVLDDRGQLFRSSRYFEGEFIAHELTILTNAVIVCEVKRVGSNAGRTLQSCASIASIVSVFDMMFTDQDDSIDTGRGEEELIHGFQIIMTSDSIAFLCPDEIQKEAWLRAIEFAVKNENSRDEAHFGWQHGIMRTSMHSAAWVGDDEMLFTAIDANHPVDIPDAEGFCPIHYAVIRQHLECLRILLDSDADPNKLSSEFRSPAQYCELKVGSGQDQKRLDDMLELLDDYGSDDAKTVLDINKKRQKSVKFNVSRMFSRLTTFSGTNDESVNLRSSDTNLNPYLFA